VVEPQEVRRPTRDQVYRRRLLALVVVAAVIGACAWAGIALIREHRRVAPQPTTTVVAPKVLKILVPEGFTRAETAVRAHEVSPAIGTAAYLRETASSQLPGAFAGDGKARNLEGFLFPATYDVYDNDPAQVLLDKQLVAFRQNWAKVDLRHARSKNLTPYDVLIIASMIEKEAVVESERPLIAAVIYNRLHARIPLGIDATIRYALGVPGTESLTNADLRDPTPYNTRLHRGLPPTPICNPGLASMQAAAHPARVDYLYFVAKPDKRHHYFTASFDDFNRYKAAHGYG
jgi:peptidoglycan lytic transglycosylase G